MPVKAVFILPAFLLVAAGFALYDNREHVQRIWHSGRRAIALKLREIADELATQDEEEMEIEELLRRRRGSASSAGQRKKEEEAGVESSGVEVVHDSGELRKRGGQDFSSAEKYREQEHEKMAESFLSAATHHTIRDSIATLSPGPAIVHQTSAQATPRGQPLEPTNPFESGYDTQHSSPALEPSSTFSHAAYWSVNDWVHSTNHPRSPQLEAEIAAEGVLTPTSDDDDALSVVSEPSMAGSGRADEVRSLDGGWSGSEKWSEVGSDVSEGSEAGENKKMV